MYHFIVNPKARSGMGYFVWNTVKTELEQRQIPYQIHFTHFEFHAAKIATELCETISGTIHIVVLGGDGTMNEVINGISSYENILLGYIPSGSSNDLARSLGIPNDPLKALDLILSSKNNPTYDHGVIEVQRENYNKDLLQNNKRKFSVSTGIGFDASICYEALDSNIKRFLNKIKLGKLTYVAIALKQVIRYKPCDAHLIIDNKEYIQLKNIFFIASMIHPCEGGGFCMSPNANPTDGKLSVCAIYNISKVKSLILLVAVIFKKHHLFQGVKLFDCSNLEIRTNEKLIVHTDGEFAGRFDHINIACTNEQIRMLL